MDHWYLILWILAVVGVLAAMYGLHRLGLWLEARGHIYYLHKKPGGGAAGCFVALQRAVDPQVQHVLVVREEAYRKVDEAAGTGPGDSERGVGRSTGCAGSEEAGAGPKPAKAPSGSEDGSGEAV